MKFNKLIYALSLRGMGIYNYRNNRISGESWSIGNTVINIGENLITFDVAANISTYFKEIIRKNVSVKKYMLSSLIRIHMKS
jgi:hypothetical protein